MKNSFTSNPPPHEFKLKILIRILKDLKILDIKKYLLLEDELQEIGKMLGGWIKFVK